MPSAKKFRVTLTYTVVVTVNELEIPGWRWRIGPELQGDEALKEIAVLVAAREVRDDGGPDEIAVEELPHD